MQKQFEKRLRVNHLIRVPEVQVMSTDGKQLGVMPTYEAMRLAGERGLDLVEVGPTAKPPLAKIMDYGKYMYQKEKKDRGQKGGKTTSQEVKTVKIGFRTESHDMAISAGKADKFLVKGYRLRLELSLRGREKEMAEIGRKKLSDFSKLLSIPYVIDDPIKRFPGGIGMLIRPDNKKQK